jgi:hypothetical protein
MKSRDLAAWIAAWVFHHCTFLPTQPLPRQEWHEPEWVYYSNEWQVRTMPLPFNRTAVIYWIRLHGTTLTIPAFYDAMQWVPLFDGYSVGMKTDDKWRYADAFRTHKRCGKRTIVFSGERKRIVEVWGTGKPFDTPLAATPAETAAKCLQRLPLPPTLNL